MKKEKMQVIIRIILALVMVYFVYKETGIVTAIFATTMAIYTEIDSFNSSKQRKFNAEIMAMIEFLTHKKL